MKNLARDTQHKVLLDGFDAKIKSLARFHGDRFEYPNVA